MDKVPGEFETIYRSHCRLVRGALRRLGVPPAQLEDATQDVFVVLHRRMAAFDGRRPLRNWLWGIARGVASTYRRSARRRHRLGQALACHGARPGPSLDDTLTEHEAMRRLDRFLRQLDEDRCAVFVLSELEGCTGPEIAARLQINLNTVYARLRSARRGLLEAQEASRKPTLAGCVFAWPWRWPSMVSWTASGAVALSLTVVFEPTQPEPWAVHGRLATPAAVPVRGAAVKRSNDLPTTQNARPLAKDSGEGGGTVPTPEESIMQRPSPKYALVTTLLATAAAPAVAAEPEGRNTGAVDRYLEFEADSLEGEVLRPMESLVPTRGTIRQPSLIQVRAHFNPEIIRLGEDV